MEKTMVIPQRDFWAAVLWRLNKMLKQQNLKADQELSQEDIKQLAMQRAELKLMREQAKLQGHFYRHWP